MKAVKYVRVTQQLFSSGWTLNMDSDQFLFFFYYVVLLVKMKHRVHHKWWFGGQRVWCYAQTTTDGNYLNPLSVGADDDGHESSALSFYGKFNKGSFSVHLYLLSIISSDSQVLPSDTSVPCLRVFKWWCSCLDRVYSHQHCGQKRSRPIGVEPRSDSQVEPCGS